MKVWRIVGDVAPEVRQEHDLGERGGHEARRQARAFAAVMQDRLRHALDHVAAAGRRHQAGDADALAAFDQNLGERQRDDQCAVELGVAHERRGEHHRRRAVGPNPHRVRRFPFQFAHIEMIVPRRAPPVDAGGRLAGDEAAVLPEILAGPGAAAAVQAVDHGGRDAAGFQQYSVPVEEDVQARRIARLG